MLYHKKCSYSGTYAAEGRADLVRRHAGEQALLADVQDLEADLAERRAFLRRKRLALLDALVVAERLKPRALDEHPPLDEPELGENLLKFGALVRIASVNRTDREK